MTKKLVILDSTDGSVHIFDYVHYHSSEELEEFIEELGFSLNNCQWMITKEYSPSSGESAPIYIY